MISVLKYFFNKADLCLTDCSFVEFVSSTIDYLLLTWNQESKAGRLSALCPNITNPWCTPVTCTCQTCGTSWKQRLSIVLRKVEGIWREQTATRRQREKKKKRGRDMLKHEDDIIAEGRKKKRRLSEGRREQSHEWKTSQRKYHQDSSKYTQELRYWFRKENIAPLDRQSLKTDH